MFDDQGIVLRRFHSCTNVVRRKMGRKRVTIYNVTRFLFSPQESLIRRVFSLEGHQIIGWVFSEKRA